MDSKHTETMTFQDVKNTFTDVYSSLSDYPFILNILKIVSKFLAVILFTSLAHWSLVLTYTNYCFETGWAGAFKNILTLGSPFCQFVNYAQFELSKHYITIWASAAVAAIAWTVAKIK